MVNWIVREDGTFDLQSSTLSLVGAYPGIDSVPIRAIAVRVARLEEAVTITYSLLSGELRLTLGADGDLATASLALRGFRTAPNSVEPICWAHVVGAESLFRQGRGMAGGSGLTELPHRDSVSSYSITGILGSGSEATVLWADDSSRFEQESILFRLPGDQEDLRVSAGFKTEAIPLTDKELTLPPLYLRPFDQLSEGLTYAARTIGAGMKARPIRPASFHWCSWYYLYHNLTITLLQDYLAGFNAMAPRAELDYVQIDAGYFPSCGDWLLPNDRYPGGLAPALERVKAAGYRPGIWIGPFMVGNRSQLAMNHPDWLLRDREGSLVTPWRHYGEPKVWGYPDEETNVLDTSHPDAMTYLREVFRTMKAWGAEMFKTDFMFWGLQDSTRVLRHVPGKTSVEYFRDVLSAIREEIGAETFWLGCIAPYFPFVGYADAMRIGGDVGVAWSGGFGPQNMIQETVGNQHLNNVLWQNDPDVLLIRDFHSELTSDEVSSLAVWQAVLGGVVATSDPLHLIAEDRAALWRFLRPSPSVQTAKLPLMGAKDRPLVATRNLTNGDVVVVAFNPTERRVCDRLRFSELGVAEVRFVYERTHLETMMLGRFDELFLELPPHGSKIFHLAETDVPIPRAVVF